MKFDNPFTSIINNFRRNKPPLPAVEKAGTPEKSHMRWAKGRALELLDRGDLLGAINSFVNDMSKPGVGVPNPHQHNQLVGAMAKQLLETSNLDAQKVREFIENFSD
mgnify:CR=1 FL=1